MRIETQIWRPLDVVGRNYKNLCICALKKVIIFFVLLCERPVIKEIYALKTKSVACVKIKKYIKMGLGFRPTTF